MIKNCIIYRYSEKFKDKWEIDKNKIEQSNLKECIEKATGLPKPKIKALTEIARNGKILLEEERDELYVFEVSCEFCVLKLLTAGVSPFVPINYKIWLRKENSTVVTFDAGRRLSDVGITLLAYATAGDPSSIEHLKLDKSDFIKLKNWLLANDGHTRRITFQKIEHKDMKFK